MSDGKLWLGWAGGLFVAAIVAKHVGAWAMGVAMIGLVWWTIQAEAKA